MDQQNQNNEYPTDYLDIVNEINDFIASLDAPPLDNHTKELVGSSSDRQKFGQHSGGEGSNIGSGNVPGTWNGPRSRHASGEKNVNRQQDDDDIGGDDIVDDACDKTFPFPLVEETEPSGVFGHYDYVGSDRTRSADYGDYSDCSNYGGGAYSDASSSSGGGDVADSDSGCYSHYQHPRPDAPAIQMDSRAVTSASAKNISSSCPSSTFLPMSSSSSPHAVSGYDRGPAYLSPSSSSSPSHRHHQQQQQYQPHQQVTASSVRPQSPDRLSAEFHCDPRPDSIDQRFHQVGSSAHTLAASTGKSHGCWEPNDHHDYQEPSNIPKVPESPVPKRRSPVKPCKVGESPGSGSPNPLSTSPRHLNASATLKEPVRECSYAVIQKQAPSTANQAPSSSPQKLNIKNRWPPAAASNDSPQAASPAKFSGKNNDRDQPQRQQDHNHRDRQQIEGQNPARQHPVPIPITRVPDLSVLISELRSVSPKSELSPNSNYTTTARSESISPQNRSRADTQSPIHQSRSESQSPSHPPQKVFSHHSRADQSSSASRNKAGKDRSANQSPGRLQKQPESHSSPSRKPHPRTLSPSQKHSANGVRCRSDSPEHDYEPIENLQLEVPPTPRPQTKFPHPQGPAMAESGGQPPKHVKALHNFKGSNNDELCFKKGDIITVTQCLEGGWWEGTLNGRTGWFPSNYAKEVKADISYKNNKSGDVPVYKRESMQLYHNVVLKNVIETERTHVSEMLKVLQSYIKPIEATNILTPPEYTLLVGNLEEIITFQQSFLAALEECEKLPSNQRRIGGAFMQFAPRIKELYSAYCANHPKAVSVLQKKREELSKFIESQGAPSPGAQTLTTILSKPFTRLDRYPSLLKELERHVEESHPDRGDTQRAIAVYRNIANSCLEIRKLKEMEHEIITSSIQGWEGEEISKLGEVIHLSQVKMITQTGEKYERIFVLFSSCLVMLSMSSRLSSYQYEGKIPLSGLSASPCENAESFQNAFEISGPMIEKITVLCGTKYEVTAWIDILNQQLSQSGNPASSAKPQSLQVHMISTCQPSVSTVTPAKTAQISSNPPTAPPPQYPLSTKTSSVWSLTCLRPSPPLRPTLMCREEVLKSPRTARKSTHKRKPVRTFSGEETDWHSKNDPKVYNEDAFILQVIEAYCNSVKTRHTVNSCRIEVAKKKANEGKAILNSPQILLAEEEKIFDETEQQERTVVDTVYALQDRVKELEQEQRKLRQDLEEEKRCRKKLEMLVRQQVIKSGVVDGVPDGGS